MYAGNAKGRCVRCGGEITLERQKGKFAKYWVFPCKCRDTEYDSILVHIWKHMKRFAFKCRGRK